MMTIFNDDEQKRIFADNLNYYVRRSGKEQKQICIEMDIKTSTFNQWTKAKALPAVSDIRKVADYFNIGVCDLVDPYVEDSISSSTKQRIIYGISRLNRAGQTKVEEYINDLLSSDKYIKKASEMVSGE